MTTKNETEHTPGPWHVESTINGHASAADDLVMTSDGAYVIARCATDAGALPWSEIKSNARLIAAAPELLEALRRIVRINGSTGGHKAMVAEFKFLAEQALAKAEGK